MKSLLFLSLLSIINGRSDLIEKKLGSNLRLEKTEKDKTLTKQESLFEFNTWDGFTGKVIPFKTFSYSINGIESSFKTDANGIYKMYVKPGKYKFQIFYNQDFFEIYSDSIIIKPQFHSTVRVTFESSKHPVICDKPVIYLYSDSVMNVRVSLLPVGELIFTYPQYNNGWECKVLSGGTIEVKSKAYNYLFWEGKMEMNTAENKFENGFVVASTELVSFFEEKLTLAGLTSKESADFITYWVPRMKTNSFNKLHFVFNEEYNAIAQLNVQPKPQSMLRLYMYWSKCDESTQLKSQKIPSFNRSGFTLLEWGGSEVQILAH